MTRLGHIFRVTWLVRRKRQDAPGSRTPEPTFLCHSGSGHPSCLRLRLQFQVPTCGHTSRRDCAFLHFSRNPQPSTEDPVSASPAPASVCWYLL